ncbi:MAG: hypothetical protein R2736_08970 [Solirubrobacterales bacterium]
MATAGRSRSRTVRLVEQRLSIVRLLVALFVARIVVTIAEIAESRLTLWSVLISAAIGIEAWRAWRVRRAARRAGEVPPRRAPTRCGIACSRRSSATARPRSTG